MKTTKKAIDKQIQEHDKQMSKQKKNNGFHDDTRRLYQDDLVDSV